MWHMFFTSVLVQALLLFLPGAILSSLLFEKSQLSMRLCVAPALSVAMYGILGILLSACGVFGSIATCLEISVPTLLALVVWVILRRRYPAAPELTGVWRIQHLLLVVCIAALIIGVHFVRQLDGPESYSQQADNIVHLSVVSEIALDGNYSALNVTSYPIDPQSQHVVPYDTSGFYPNGFHVVASFAVSLLGVSVPLAENAAVFVFCALAFPAVMTGLGWFFLGRPTLSKTLSVAFAATAFVSFPLALLTFGPLVSNLAAFCCMMSSVLLFIMIIEQRILSVRVKAVVLFTISCVGVALLQPNGIFSIGVFLIPYTASRVNSYIAFRTRKRLLPTLATFGYLIGIILLWLILVFAPFMKSVVMFDWAALETPWTILNTIITLSLRFGVPQYALALLCFLGLLVNMRSGNTWYVGSLVLMIVLYSVGNSTDSIFKHIATGFWYTDQWRTSAIVAIFAMPAAACGLNFLLEHMSKFVGAKRANASSPYLGIIVMGVFVLCMVVVFRPSYTYSNGESDLTAFGKLDSDLEEIYEIGPAGPHAIYTSDERDFVKKVKEIVGENELVLNMPYDGSVYSAYEIGLNVYYKTYAKGAESSYSRLIRTELNRIDSSSEVRSAVDFIGAKYLMILNLDGFTPIEHNGMWSLCGQYNPKDWAGFEGDFSQIPCFKLLLSDGTMRLYEIG